MVNNVSQPFSHLSTANGVRQMSNILLSCRSRITKEELIFKKIQKQLMKGIPIMIQNYINKYNTPRVFQILTTIAFLSLACLMFGLTYDGYGIVFELIGYNVGYPVAEFARVVVTLVTVPGIVFIWLNRPKYSAAFGAPLLLVMLISLFFDREDEYVYDTYYILWIFAIALAVFLVLSILSTEYGPRQLQTVKIIQPISGKKSSADEIMKFKELLDSGVITQEEFDAKKKEILGV